MTLKRALIRTGEFEAIVSIFTASTGRVELPGVGQLSPPEAGWSGDGYRIADVEPTEIPSGKVIASVEVEGVELVEGVPCWILTDAPLPPRRMVAKSLVTQRVIDAGKIDQAMALLQGDWGKFARWVAPDQPAVYSDDPDTVAMVMVLGLDPEVIMASEA